MKIEFRRWKGTSRESGSVLLISVVICAALGLSLAGYMSYVSIHAQTINRSQNWNSGVPIVESGIEEAMTHLNFNIFGTSATNVTTRWANDGWQWQSGEYVAPTRTIEGSTYNVRISTNRGGTYAPEIVCVGRTVTFGYGAGADGNSTRGLTTNHLFRQIRIRTQRMDINAYGMLADGNITLNGQIRVDSFNSMTTNSWYGIYDERFHSDEGTIASISGDINMGAQGVLYGTNLTSAGQSAVNGTVGDIAWVNEEDNEGLTQPGHYLDNFNHPGLEPVPDPSGASLGWPPGPRNDSYTLEDTGTNVTLVTSDTYPNPPPPVGNITTNSAGNVTTHEWPSHIDPTLIYTNLSGVVTNATYPADIAPHLVTTNGASWHTNWAVDITTPPVYPESPARNITRYDEWVTYAMEEPGPRSGTYVEGSVSGGPPFSTGRDVDQVKGTSNPKKYNYKYQRIMNYSYQYPETYSWETNSYSYPTFTYTYYAPITEPIVVTREFAFVLEDTPGGYYEMSYLSLSGHDQILVKGDAVLWVTGQINMSAQSQIIILPGASLTIYAGGDMNLGGQGIVNYNKNALDLTIYGLEGCTDIAISGNASFTGTIYAPFADLSANGGGNDSFDIVGAITAKSIRMNGQFNFHYDSNLRDAGRVGGYVVRGWYEEKVGTN